jgi:hypothetical protein
LETVRTVVENLLRLAKAEIDPEALFSSIEKEPIIIL